MAEYIDREEYCEKHCRCSNEYCDKESCPIWKVPVADVAPVVHGRWNVVEGRRLDNAICSVVGVFRHIMKRIVIAPTAGRRWTEV